eukprot:TRINITY_DN4476_c0_g1_i13.p4 TRINITY_DN4476_c0_g1~~TRINITY_DN4476_c0_g1_i13.p4  ORF type:complete len:153 (-),score=9.75 TRINITY_DN4476_c0_g1_i13:558-1016(-)
MSVLWQNLLYQCAIIVTLLRSLIEVEKNLLVGKGSKSRLFQREDFIHFVLLLYLLQRDSLMLQAFWFGGGFYVIGGEFFYGGFKSFFQVFKGRFKGQREIIQRFIIHKAWGSQQSLGVFSREDQMFKMGLSGSPVFQLKQLQKIQQKIQVNK